MVVCRLLSPRHLQTYFLFYFWWILKRVYWHWPIVCSAEQTLWLAIPLVRPFCVTIEVPERAWTGIERICKYLSCLLDTEDSCVQVQLHKNVLMTEIQGSDRMRKRGCDSLAYGVVSTDKTWPIWIATELVCQSDRPALPDGTKFLLFPERGWVIWLWLTQMTLPHPILVQFGCSRAGCWVPHKTGLVQSCLTMKDVRKMAVRW